MCSFLAREDVILPFPYGMRFNTLGEDYVPERITHRILGNRSYLVPPQKAQNRWSSSIGTMAAFTVCVQPAAYQIGVFYLADFIKWREEQKNSPTPFPLRRPSAQRKRRQYIKNRPCRGFRRSKGGFVFCACGNLSIAFYKNILIFLDL